VIANASGRAEKIIKKGRGQEAGGRRECCFQT
jgi:hypothetical protein